ncbi:TonB family protein [Bosea sp. CS1GBMeth4]|uniref:TonB family protein n=1 Tax=Bosea sp. CS1GBMeth4 TaxID=1892849 RepID=UPI0016468AEE|nr:TonB family protein [Bosea sp. CS1GBMeth4]
MIAPAPERRWLAALRWGAAALTVAAVHGGLAWVGVNWRPMEAAAGAPEPAVMIELAALSVAPEAPPEELPVAPERAEPERPPEPVKETPPPEPEPEPAPEPTPVEPPEIRLPDLPQVPKLDAVLLPPPEPKPAEKKPPPKPKIVERKDKPKPRIVERKPAERRAREAVAPKPSEQRASAPSSAAQGTASQPMVSTASWRGSLIAHLNRYKRFPAGASPGTVQVAFAIDRSGNVLSSRVVGSSGDSALDGEAAAMIRRASPVPAPPAGVGGGGTVSLSVPVRFSR